MGFEDVIKDGLIIGRLREETNKYNRIYFGDGSSINQQVKKGQLEKFTEAKKSFLEKQFAEVKKYFSYLGWDYTEKNGKHSFRANADVYIDYKYEEECYIEFMNKELRKVYNIRVDSDFMENPYYALDRNSKVYGSNKYVPKGGEATRPEMIEERLDEIKAVVEHNDSLKGKYNFRIMVDKNAISPYCHGTEIKWVEFVTVMDIINEISEEYY